MINKKFGKLLVIKEHSTTRSNQIRYNCLCDCGNEINSLGSHLRSLKVTHCGCNIAIGSAKTQWTGVGDMSGGYWYNHIVRSANGDKGRRVALELSIDKEYAWDLFVQQGKKCALSGIPLKFPLKAKDKAYNVSLDRIDSSKGYIKGNVQWVHKDINMMKNKLNDEYFINMCKLVALNCSIDNKDDCESCGS